MKSASSKMALKPYLEAVKNYCEGLSREELSETILQLAQEVPVNGRKDFINKLESFMPKPVSKKKNREHTSLEKKLLDKIEALKEEIAERISAIEDGAYWDDHDWDYDYYEEEPDYVSEEQIEELEDIFLEVESFFLNSRLETAGRLYGALFDLFDEIGELERCSFSSTDIREARARHCRCVYETSDPADRAQAFFEAMCVYAGMNEYRLDLSREKYPLARDVIDSRLGDMDGWESFLPAWEKLLASCDTDRGAVLQMETVNWLNGTEGVAGLAKQWKAEQPLGYLFWIQCVAENKDWKGVINACQETLDVLPKSSFREQASKYLEQAGKELGENKYILMGKRERFISSSDEENLLDLLEEASIQDMRSGELEAILASGKEIRRSRDIEKDLYIKILLMAGRLKQAFKEGKNEESVGWSFGKAGVLFGSILVVLTENSEKAVTIRSVLKRYADNSYYSFGDKADRTYAEMIKGLAEVRASKSETRQFLEWADEIGCARIEYIVSNQHRKAYKRAAEVLGALTECYVLLENREKAMSLFNSFYSDKFRRHIAFRREVKNVVGDSGLLKTLRVV
ncbi:MAG: hypothetical protein GY795_40580 [Desulfobacterales bacterium]|nr:hypothetical protein [Desulfobacterales bacterium]